MGYFLNSTGNVRLPLRGHHQLSDRGHCHLNFLYTTCDTGPPPPSTHTHMKGPTYIQKEITYMYFYVCYDTCSPFRKVKLSALCPCRLCEKRTNFVTGAASTHSAWRTSGRRRAKRRPRGRPTPSVSSTSGTWRPRARPRRSSRTK